MKKLLMMILCLSAMMQAKAQFPGYSRFYEYVTPLLVSDCRIDALISDTSNQWLYFALNTGPGSKVAALTKTGYDGNIVQQYYDTAQHTAINYISSLKSEDGAYIYWLGTTQNTTSGQNNLPEIKLLKTDLDLNTIWEKYYPLNDDEGHATSIKNAGNNKLLIFYSDNGPVNTLRIDSTGSVSDFYIFAYGTSGVSSDEKGWIITTPHSIYKYDSLTNEEWNNEFIVPPFGNYLKMSLRSRDGNEAYYASGQSILTDYTNPNWDMSIHSGLVLKYTADGNLIWSKAVPIGCITITDVAPPYDFHTSIGFQGMTNAPGNDIVLAGTGSRDPILQQKYKGIITRLDSNGNIRWNYFYTLPDIEKEVLTNVVSLPDGSFIASGYTGASGSSYGKGWLLRVDSSGCYNASCSGIETPDSCSAALAVSKANAPHIDLDIYPNPAADQVYIRSGLTFDAGSNITVMDVWGRTIAGPVSLINRQQSYTLDVSRYVTGTYFLKIKIGNQLFHKKIEVVH